MWLPPIPCLHRILGELQGSHFVHMLAAMIVVQDLHGGRKKGGDLVPDPFGPIAEHAQAHLVLGNQPGSFDLPQRCGRFLIRLDLVPAQQMYDPLLIDQVEAKALGLLPFSLPPCPLGPHAPAARVDPWACSGRVGT